MRTDAPNALALEYQRDYGTAGRDLNVAHLMNNPAASGKCRVLGLSLTEQPLDMLLGHVGALGDDSADSGLIAQDAIEPLSEGLLF